MSRTLKRWALSSVGLALANLILLALFAASAPSPPLFRLQRPVRLLVLAAHQDDEVIQAGGLLIKNAALGGKSVVAYLTNSSNVPGSSDREREARSVWAEFSGEQPELQFLQFVSKREWTDQDKRASREALKEVVSKVNPEITLIPLEEGGSYEHDLLNNLCWSIAPEFPKVRWVQAAEYNPYYLAEKSPGKLLWFLVRLLPFVPYVEPNYGLFPENQQVLEMSEAELRQKKALLAGYQSQADIIPLSQFGYPDLFEDTRQLPTVTVAVIGKKMSPYTIATIMLITMALFFSGAYLASRISWKASLSCLGLLFALGVTTALVRPLLIKEEFVLILPLLCGAIITGAARLFNERNISTPRFFRSDRSVVETK